MAYADLAEVQRQSTADVRRLSASGDPRERLWAAWTLGLRGPKHHRWLARRSRLDPTPGVRRHLIVILAGLGRHEDLWASADDPDVRVRATALHWLCRICDPNDMVTWDRIMSRFGYDQPSVRAAIIRGLPAKAPSDVLSASRAAATDPSEDVRTAFCDRLADPRWPVS